MNGKGNRYVYLLLFVLALLIAMDAYFILYSSNEREMSERNRHELSELDKMVDNRLKYRERRKYEIDSVMLQLHKHEDKTEVEQYNINKQMLLKTQMFSYEDAKQFAKKLRLLSKRINDENMIAEAQILSSSYLTQSCLFVEALELLQNVDPHRETLTRETLEKYYYYMGIAHQRMAVYVRDTVFINQYNAKGIELFGKCIEYSDNPAIKNFVSGRIKERQSDMRSAQLFYQKALDCITPDDGNTLLSLMLSSLAKSFKHQGKAEEATYYYIKAVQLDIREAMNASIAIVDLADFLFTYYNNVSEARKYLGISIDNGEYYGMRSQITRIDSMFLMLSEIKMKRDLFISITSMMIMVCICSILFILIRQNNRSKRKLQHYQECNSSFIREKELLMKENSRLNQENDVLSNSNKLKNIHIGKLLETNGETMSMVNSFIMKANIMFKSENYKQLQKALREMESSFTKKEQLSRFDEMFLSLFPSFISDFKRLMPADYVMETGPKEMLTPSMRIFALVRLGINDNQQIAHVLDYSYNTILNYRLRVRNMALNPDTFEDDIMNIGV